MFGGLPSLIRLIIYETSLEKEADLTERVINNCQHVKQMPGIFETTTVFEMKACSIAPVNGGHNHILYFELRYC